MKGLESLTREARSLDVVEFKKRHGGLYLLGTIPAEPEDDWSFTTDIRGFDSLGQRSVRPSREADMDRIGAMTTPSLWPVEKSDRNTWRRRITVGRATNNDVIIRHHSISKLHAQLQLGALSLIGLGRSGELHLSDAGSQNGTYLSDRRLLPEETEPVKSGAHIRFGDVACKLLDAEALHRNLRMVAR